LPVVEVVEVHHLVQKRVVAAVVPVVIEPEQECQ
jgi:hypothetical protein